MNRRYNVLFVCLLVLSLKIVGQDLRIISTKELTGIAEKYGLDSALWHFPDISLMYYMDETTTEQLINQIQYNKPSFRTEKFLLDYTFCVNKREMSGILYDYYYKKKDEIKDYVPSYSGRLPLILYESLFALVENPSAQTDSLLSDYYELWNEKSTYYKQDYARGLEETDRDRKNYLMRPYEQCNLNCYILQYFLNLLGSPFYSQEKMEYHQAGLSAYYLSNGVDVRKNPNCSQRVPGVEKPDSIKMTNGYNSIGDIDFNQEAELKQLFERYSRSHCWKHLIYNDKIGDLAMGCDLDGIVYYRLELINDNLMLHLYRVADL